MKGMNESHAKTHTAKGGTRRVAAKIRCLVISKTPFFKLPTSHPEWNNLTTPSGELLKSSYLATANA